MLYSHTITHLNRCTLPQYETHREGSWTTVYRADMFDDCKAWISVRRRPFLTINLAFVDVEHASGTAGRSPPARNLPQLQYEGFENTPFDDELDEPGDIIVSADSRAVCSKRIRPQLLFPPG